MSKASAPGPPMPLGKHARAWQAQPHWLLPNDACRHQELIDVSSYPPETARFEARFEGRANRIQFSNAQRRGNLFDTHFCAFSMIASPDRACRMPQHRTNLFLVDRCRHWGPGGDG
jgi:hypothetical protein